MALLEVRRRDYAGAIESYLGALKIDSDDRASRIGLARAFAYSGEYNAARGEFQKVLLKHPGDTDALEGIAHVEAWSGNAAVALAGFRTLAAQHPADLDYTMGIARAETALHQYAAARETLTALLRAHPKSRDAKLQMAYLDLFEGHQAEALRRFNQLIGEDPTDSEALQGNARIAYYRGELKYAHDLAAKIVDDDPDDPAALLLLANIARALHDPSQARALVLRLKTLDPRDPEVRDLEEKLEADAQPTLHTSAGYAREVASGFPPEDLIAWGYESTVGFTALPRSDSHLSVAYLPSQIPGGQKPVGPSALFYRQTSYVTPALTVQGSIGMERFGSAESAWIPLEMQPITAAGVRPFGSAGLTYAFTNRLKLDFTAARIAITYTPTSVHLGVMENQLLAGAEYRFESQTVRVEAFSGDYSTISYAHELGMIASEPIIVNKVDRDHSKGASLTFNRRFVTTSRLALDAGYSALVYGFSGGSSKVLMGFFNPDFYQRHYLTAHLAGKIHGPLGYDFSAAGGVQQIAPVAPVQPAVVLNPALTLKVSPRLSLSAGYTHYNSSETLGVLHGNAVRLSSDWRF